jgi:hypothetical protein
MHGNVWQWCQDQIDPKLPHRRLRGGSYASGDILCHAAYQSQNYQGSNRRDMGFRLVRVKQSAVKQGHAGTAPGKTEPTPIGDPAAILKQARAHAGRWE